MTSDDSGRRTTALRMVVWPIGVLAGLTILVFLLYAPPLGPHPSASRLAHCKNNLHQIGLAMVNYAEDYGEYYPFDERGPLHSLALLYPDYLQDPKPFRCRIASARKGGANPLVSFPWDTPLAGIPCDYGYTWHTTYRNPEMMFAIVADMPQNHDAIKTRANRFNVLFFDTHVSSKRTPFCSSDPADNIFAREPGWSPDTDAYIRQTPD